MEKVLNQEVADVDHGNQFWREEKQIWWQDSAASHDERLVQNVVCLVSALSVHL